jgi:hypothetical protein
MDQAPMTIEEEILVNQLAQGIVEMPTGESWFAGLTESTQRSVLRELNIFIANAGPHSEDAARAVALSGLESTFTPCVLLTTGINTRHQLAKISSLPRPELGKSFRLLIALLAVADTRRKTTNPINATNHWWHHDLRDPGVLDAIRQEYSH